MAQDNRFLANYSSAELNDIVFWSRGNYPTQQIHNLSLEGLRRDFAVSYLLAHQMFLAASFFFESEKTRTITRQYEPVFRRGEALYFIDDNLSGFTEHGIRKRGKSPSGMYGYQDTVKIIEYGSYLDQLGFVLRRTPKAKISTEMRKFWLSDVNSASPQSIGAAIQKEVGTERDETVRMALSETALNSARQETDFVWPYIKGQLDANHIILTESLEDMLQAKLSDLYCTTTATGILKTSLDSHIGGTRRFDPKLFWACMRAGKVTDYFDRLSVADLISLKHSDIFFSFRSYYLKVIDLVEHTTTLSSSDAIDLRNPQHILETLCRSTARKYDQPISQLKELCDHFCSSVERLELLDSPEWSRLFYTDVLAPNLKLIGGNKTMFGRILVYTALKHELDAVLRYYPNTKQFDSDGTLRTVIHNCYAGYDTEVLFFTSNAMGSTVSAADCARLLERYRPDAVLLVGITAGFDRTSPEFKFGDLLAGEQIVGYELAKVKDGGMDRRFDVYRGSYNLIKAVHDTEEVWNPAIMLPRPDGDSGIKKPKVHTGVILSGNKVVASYDFKVSLSESWSKAIGAEMEAWGTAVAAHRSGRDVPFLCLKSVCDWAEGDKNDVWQNYCAAAAADFLAALLPRIRLEEFPSATRLTPAQDKPAAPVSPAEPASPLQDRPADPVPPAEPATSLQDRPAAPVPPTEAKKAVKKLSGKISYQLSLALGNSWQDIAQILEIPVSETRRFKEGSELYDIINFVNSAQKIPEFVDALETIERPDCVKLITEYLEGESK